MTRCITRECENRPMQDSDECFDCYVTREAARCRYLREKSDRELDDIDAEGMKGDARTPEFWEAREE